MQGGIAGTKRRGTRESVEVEIVHGCLPCLPSLGPADIVREMEVGERKEVERQSNTRMKVSGVCTCECELSE